MILGISLTRGSQLLSWWAIHEYTQSHFPESMWHQQCGILYFPCRTRSGKFADKGSGVMANALTPSKAVVAGADCRLMASPIELLTHDSSM